MSKRSQKKVRVNKRWKLLESEIDYLFESLKYESFTEYKSLIENEIIKIIKKHNLLSWCGRNWKVITSINLIDNTYTFDVRTVRNNWRVLRIIR